MRFAMFPHLGRFPIDTFGAIKGDAHVSRMIVVVVRVCKFDHRMLHDSFSVSCDCLVCT